MCCQIIWQWYQLIGFYVCFLCIVVLMDFVYVLVGQNYMVVFFVVIIRVFSDSSGKVNFWYMWIVVY